MHVLTHKGEGYLPAETDDEKRLHDIGAFDPETGVPLGAQRRRRTPPPSPKRSSSSAESTPRSSRITAGMPGSTGLLPFAERFPDRCFDVGIAEQHAVTAAAGMAMRGLRPVVAIYSTFLTRAWDQIVYDVGLHALPVVFCIDRAGITGDDGPSHHGLYDLALLTKVPGMTLFAPSSYEEVAVMLDEALRITSGPVALRWPKTAARHVVPDEVGPRPQRARVCAPGGDVCILAVGKMVEAAEEAADAARRARRARRRCGTCARSRSTRQMLADAAVTPRGHRRGRHRRGRGRRAARGRPRRAWRATPAPPVTSRSARPPRTSRTASPPSCSPTSASTAPASPRPWPSCSTPRGSAGRARSRACGRRPGAQQ